RRSALLREAAAEAWSVAELGRRLARRYGPRAVGGRPLRMPADPAGVMTRVEQACESFRRLARQLHAVSGRRMRSPADRLPPEVRDQLEIAENAVIALQLTLDSELARQRAGRASRAGLRPVNEATTCPSTPTASASTRRAPSSRR